MLVLARRQGESILIGDNVRVRVLKVLTHDKVRIGIDAPDDVVVLREELAARQPQEATHGSGD